MRHLGLGSYAKPSCKSPFRTDSNPSWGIFETGNGWRFKDHGTGESGDEIAFLANYLRLDQREDYPLLLGVLWAVAQKVRRNSDVQPAPTTGEAETNQQPDRTGFGSGNCELHRELAELRGFSIGAVDWAVERGVLVFGEWHGHQCYGVGDSSKRLFELRRLDGLDFPAAGALQPRKSHTVKHSQKSWPVGLPEASTAANLLLVEGLPDFIAAHELIVAGQLMAQWAPVAMLSAGVAISKDALAAFHGKQVVICFHNDTEHQGLKGALKWRDQLEAAKCGKVSLLDTGKLADLAGGGIKDLNDYLVAAKSGQHTHLPPVSTLLSNF